MSRRRRSKRREVDPDILYGSQLVTKLIHTVMRCGKKSLAGRIVYRALEVFAKNVRADDVVEALIKAIENVRPTAEVKTRRIGAANCQVPVEVPEYRGTSLALRWIRRFAKARVGKTMIEGLSMELSDCFNNQGSSVKQKETIHRMAQANRAYASGSSIY